MSGYDLKKVIDLSIQHFWPADQSQIYRTLNRLADQELVEVDLVVQEDRPDRKVYSITPAGKEELLAWLHTAMPKNQPRVPGFIQVFFAANLTDEEIIDKFEKRAEALREQLGMLKELPNAVKNSALNINSARDAYCWQLTLLAGVMDLSTQLQWIELVIADIRKGTIPERGEPFKLGQLNDWLIADIGIKY